MFDEDEAHEAADGTPQKVEAEILDGDVFFAVDGAWRGGESAVVEQFFE